MKHSSQPRKTVDLSESVHRRLNMYALAAGAAGMGMLALARAAEARFCTRPLTRKLGESFPSISITTD